MVSSLFFLQGGFRPHAFHRTRGQLDMMPGVAPALASRTKGLDRGDSADFAVCGIFGAGICRSPRATAVRSARHLQTGVSFYRHELTLPACGYSNIEPLQQPPPLRASFSRGTYRRVLAQPRENVPFAIADRTANSSKWNAFALPSLTLDVPNGTGANGGYSGRGEKCIRRCVIELVQQREAGFFCHSFNLQMAVMNACRICVPRN
jgi:hypothetical protein